MMLYPNFRSLGMSIFLIGTISCFLISCGDDSKTAGGTEEDSAVTAIVNKTVSGVSQKGPFVNGSSVTVQELDGESLAQTGNSYEGKIKNDMGEFSVKVARLASQYALLKANGFYRNEVTGEKSKSQVTLYALTDLSDRDEVNVNLLTHLEYERSLYLAAEDSVSVASAKKQAENEVLASFGILGEFSNSEDLSIFGAGEGNAALLAVSVLMQGNLTEADFSERLANYAADIETDGSWDDYATATTIADWAAYTSLSGELSHVRSNIAGWGLSADVPAFEKYVDNYWWQMYSLGTCDKKREGELKIAENSLSQYNGVHFICADSAWRIASDIEKDTYKWKSGKDGYVKNGDVVETNCYVFEDSAWRAGNDNDCSLGLRGCTVLRQDTVGEGDDKVWYVCDNQNWRVASAIQKDSATWGEGKFDGEIRTGQVNKHIYYIYEKSEKAWRQATTLEKDTYDYKKNKDWADGEDGEIKKGAITDFLYIFDSTTWRSQDEVEKEYGFCTAEMQDSILYIDKDYSYCCYNKRWRLLQYDCSGVEDGYSIFLERGFHGSGYLVCRENKWQSVSQFEYKYGPCTEKNVNDTASADSTTIFGQTMTNYYICRENKWQSVSQFEYKYGPCTEKNVNDTASADTIIDWVRYPTYYICKENEWQTVAQVEYKYGPCTEKNANDTASADTIKPGYGLQTTYYICQEKEWKTVSRYEYWSSKLNKFNDDVDYGTLFDERDGQTYRTVTIGGQEWMAENLNYPASDYIWGKAYSWSEAMNVSSNCDTTFCDINEPHQGVCPDGWHVPSGSEWSALYGHVGGLNKAIMTASVWNVETTNDYGLSIIPAMFSWDPYKPSDLFWEPPSQSIHWSSTQYSNDIAMQWRVVDRLADLSQNPKHYAFYIRCVKGEQSISAIEKDLGACSNSIADSVRMFEGHYYICNNGVWLRTNILRYDTVLDSRDGQTYKTVTIGSQTWMAQNLNYDAAESKCFEDDEANCDVYGRLYPADVAQGVCPAGWHLPNEEEFQQLLDNTGYSLDYNTAYSFESIFEVLQAGKYDAVADGSYTIDQYSTGWWLYAQEIKSQMSFLGIFESNSRTYVLFTGDDGVNGFSVRCLKD